MNKFIKRNGKYYKVTEYQLTKKDIQEDIERLEKQLIELKSRLWEIEELEKSK